jgi:hypothetical protein
VLTAELGLVGIDLDHCRDPETSALDAWALEIVQVIDTYSSVSQVLGERFLCYRVRSAAGAAVAQRAIANQGQEKAMRQALRGAVAGFLRGIDARQPSSLSPEAIAANTTCRGWRPCSSRMPVTASMPSWRRPRRCQARGPAAPSPWGWASACGWGS